MRCRAGSGAKSDGWQLLLVNDGACFVRHDDPPSRRLMTGQIMCKDDGLAACGSIIFKVLTIRVAHAKRLHMKIVSRHARSVRPAT
jgi:hypothetical protein